MLCRLAITRRIARWNSPVQYLWTTKYCIFIIVYESECNDMLEGYIIHFQCSIKHWIETRYGAFILDWVGLAGNSSFMKWNDLFFRNNCYSELRRTWPVLFICVTNIMIWWMSVKFKVFDTLSYTYTPLNGRYEITNNTVLILIKQHLS